MKTIENLTFHFTPFLRTSETCFLTPLRTPFRA